MGFSLNNAAAAAAAGVADVATTYAKTEIGTRAAMKLEDVRAKIQAERDARQNEFTAGQNDASRQVTRDEGAATRTHQSNLQQSGFTHAENLEAGRQTHAEGLQKTALEAAAERHRESLAVQRSGQAIQSRQLDVMEKGAKLDQDIKQIQLNNATEIEKLRKEFAAEKDPDKRAIISDNLRILTGKDTDKYLPVPLKDDMGNITGYQIFDTKRGAFVDNQKSGAPGAVARPMTQADMNALPPGAKYINPADGKTYVKRGAPAAKPAAAPAQPSAARGLIDGGYASAMDSAAPRPPREPTEMTDEDRMAIP